MNSLSGVDGLCHNCTLQVSDIAVGVILEEYWGEELLGKFRIFADQTPVFLDDDVFESLSSLLVKDSFSEEGLGRVDLLETFLLPLVEYPRLLLLLHHVRVHPPLLLSLIPIKLRQKHRLCFLFGLVFLLRNLIIGKVALDLVHFKYLRIVESVSNRNAW